MTASQKKQIYIGKKTKDKVGQHLKDAKPGRESEIFQAQAGNRTRARRAVTEHCHFATLALQKL